jgi:hypothetical protein
MYIIVNHEKSLDNSELIHSSQIRNEDYSASSIPLDFFCQFLPILVGKKDCSSCAR